MDMAGRVAGKAYWETEWVQHACRQGAGQDKTYMCLDSDMWWREDGCGYAEGIWIDETRGEDWQQKTPRQMQ